MRFPDFNKNSRTSNGRKQIIRAIAQQTLPTALRDREIECWKLYHNRFDEKEMDYLRVIGEFELPAEVRHLPIQRPKIDNLVSRQAIRKFPFTALAVDKNSLSKKKENKFNYKYNAFIANVKNTYYEYMKQNFLLEKQQEALTQAMQQMGTEDPQMMQQFQLINMEIERVKGMINDMSILPKQRIDEMNKYLTYEYKDFVEEIAQKGLASLKKSLKLKEKSVESFKNHLVTGRTYFYVDYIPEMKKLCYEVFPGLKVNYGNVSDSKWTHEGPWVSIKDYWNLNDIINYYQYWLTSQQIADLKKKFYEEDYDDSDEAGNFVSIPGHGAVLDETETSAYGQEIRESGIKVVREWWLALRDITAVITKNDKDITFTHFIEGKTLLNRFDYNYDKRERTYVSKDDPEKKYSRDDVYLIHPEDDKVVTRYFYERYKGVDIGNGTVILSKRDMVQIKTIDDYYDNKLPVVGKNFNSISDQPYSLIWTTRDYQKLFNIFNYHKELLLALGGVVVMIMDMKAKPDNISRDEWFYQLKQGRLLIDSSLKYNQSHNFNQYNSFDMTFSANIQYLDMMLDKIEERMEKQIGLNSATMGEIGKNDQVGTYKMSQAQSNLTTAILFEEHDEIERRALTMLLNLAAKYEWDEGALLEVPLDGGGQDVVAIPKGLLNNVDLELVAVNTIHTEMDIQELKQFALGQASKGQLKFEHFVSMYSMDSIKELEKSLKYYTAEQEKILQQAASNEINAKAQADERKIQLENQFKAEQEKMKLQLQQMQMELTKLLSDEELAVRREELQQKKKKDDDDTAIKLLGIMSESQVENRMIDQNQQQMFISSKLQAIEMQMNNVNNMIAAKLKNKEIATKDKIESRKAAEKLKPQHVNDN